MKAPTAIPIILFLIILTEAHSNPEPSPKLAGRDHKENVVMFCLTIHSKNSHNKNKVEKNIQVIMSQFHDLSPEFKRSQTEKYVLNAISNCLDHLQTYSTIDFAKFMSDLYSEKLKFQDFEKIIVFDNDILLAKDPNLTEQEYYIQNIIDRVNKEVNKSTPDKVDDIKKRSDGQMENLKDKIAKFEEANSWRLYLLMFFMVVFLLIIIFTFRYLKGMENNNDMIMKMAEIRADRHYLKESNSEMEEDMKKLQKLKDEVGQLVDDSIANSEETKKMK